MCRIVWIIVILNAVVGILARSCVAEESYVIAGSVEFDDGTPANEVQVWLKSERGKVSTRIATTSRDGRFKFKLPPPKADSYRLLVYPYGTNYENLAPKSQELGIRLSKQRFDTAKAFRQAMEDAQERYAEASARGEFPKELRRSLAEMQKYLRAIAEFAEGVEGDDGDNAAVRKQLKDDFGEETLERIMRGPSFGRQRKEP